MSFKPSWPPRTATVRIGDAQFRDADGVMHTGADAVAAFISSFYDPLDFYLAQLGDA